MTCIDCIHSDVCDYWEKEAYPEECYSESDNKSCKHCQPPYDHFGKYYIVTGIENLAELHFLRRDDALGGVMIDYCPICGRKLEE